MSRRFVSMTLVALALAAAIIPARRLAAQLPAEEQTFFDKHLPDVVTVTPKRLTDAAITKAFGAPIYQVTLSIHEAEGISDQKLIVARSGDKLVSISRPSSDADCPDMVKMLKADFTLTSDDDAKGLQTALDTLYPVIMDDDKKAVAFHHSGREWTFVRGKFFDKYMGFVFTTDDKGKVMAIKYVLGLP